VARSQLGDHVLDAEAARLEQHHQVKQQVGAFADQRRIVAGHGGQRRLHAFLADFLRDAADAGGIQPGGVAAFRTLGNPLRDRRLQRGQEGHPCCQRILRIGKAGGCSLVAGRADRVGQHQDRVAVAVGAHLHHLQHVARGLALGPKLVAAAAEERDAALGERAAQRFGIHVAQHQHAAAAGILHDRGQQAAALVPVELRERGVSHGRISRRCCRR